MSYKNSSIIPFAALALLCALPGHAQITLNTVPTRVIGQPQLLANPVAFNPNLVEGRELSSPYGIALDTSVTPPRLYVTDTGNNRILAWKDAAGFTNGAKADMVIGQRDFYSTGANGPGTTLSTGLAAPTGIAVDQGDLYIADSANNRILRFKKPFATPPDLLLPDLCIGQPSFNSKIANYPAGQPTEKNISLNPGSVFIAAIAFDAQHNLWFTDAGNNRVLRYAASDVAKGGFNLSANLEIGQLDFISKQPALPQSQAGLQTLNQLATPAGLAFDASGRLYVADSDSGSLINRVMVFEPPFTTGMSAKRIMGAQPVPVAGAPPRTDAQIYAIKMNNPGGIFFLPGSQGIAVVDSGYSRILIFDTYDKWDPDPLVSPSAKALYGHATGIGGISSTDTKSLVSNDGNPQAGAGTLSNPQAAVLVNNELYVADARNNRLVVLPLQSGNFGVATRVLGQDRIDTNSINLIEGREFFFFAPGGAADAAVVIDSTTDTPHLYVADPYNNRVLGFRDVRNLLPGSSADIVIGQPGPTTALCNYPNGDINQPTQSSLCHPVGLLIDSSGNLYVADQGNGRVLRFPTPFSHQGNQQADVVLGKGNFVSSPLVDPSARNMYLPYGLAFAGNNGLLVSDAGLSRVLYFPFNNGSFTPADNGMAATKVFGQPDFASAGKSSSDTGMNNPHHMAADTDGRPYVVDSGNNRVLIFDQILNTPNTGAHASFALPAGGAEGIYVNANTGEIWVTDLGGAVRKYPRYDQLIFNSTALVSILSQSPIAVTQDQYGDLIVAEAYNRVTFYYPALAALNGANFIVDRALAPNVFASIFPKGIQFGKDTAVYDDRPNPIPLPTELADIRVTVNGTPAPLTFVSPTQINFVVPWNAPTTGVADVQVLKVSTGQLLAASNVPMNVVAPGIFVNTSAGAGNKLAAVINQDGSINDATHPAKRGEYISIYATGQGPVASSSQPADGDIPRNGLVGSQGILRVVVGTDYTDQVPLLGDEQRNANGDVNFIQFSGLSPQFPGMWQVNVRIPKATAPGPQPLALFLNSVPDNQFSITGYRVVFYVAPL
ncbi:MAG: hypothetical protein ABI759_32765 [Candidatus Solibacter sp.]